MTEGASPEDVPALPFTQAVINEAPRFRYMSGGQVKVPLVLSGAAIGGGNGVLGVKSVGFLGTALVATGGPGGDAGEGEA